MASYNDVKVVRGFFILLPSTLTLPFCTFVPAPLHYDNDNERNGSGLRGERLADDSELLQVR